MKEGFSITEVSNRKHESIFIDIPLRIYKKDRNYIRPLKSDILKIFDPDKNPAAKNAQFKRWLIYKDTIAVGRIAAFINDDSFTSYEQPTGNIGFVECIRNKEAFNLLFTTAVDWLKEQGMEAADGPVNLGERNEWWGLLTDGYYPPNYCMPYNKPWHKDFFERYGFKTYFRQFTYSRPIHSDLNRLIVLKAKRILSNKEYRLVHYDPAQKEKFIYDFVEAYNSAWQNHNGVKALNPGDLLKAMSKLGIFLDRKMIQLVYYKEKAVACSVLIPELNQLFKYANGKLNTAGIIKVLTAKYLKLNRKVLGLIFGVIPDFQNKGIESVLIYKHYEYLALQNDRYDEIELNWIGDFNPKMMRVMEQMGCYIKKVHTTYRLLFDKNKEFKCHPILK